MGKSRLEAFSDGVLAIIITIMVLELNVPHGTGLADLRPVLPVILSYVLSFIYIGIYWNNHHHLMHTVQRVTGRILWSNLHLLFWLSLLPFATAWTGESGSAPVPTALYGAVLLMAGVAYKILQTAIIAAHGQSAVLAQAVGRDLKGNLSLVLYLASVPLALILPRAAEAVFVLVAAMWLLPDRRIERVLARGDAGR